MIHAPTTGIGIVEQRCLEVHSCTVGTLVSVRATESLERPDSLRNSELASFHGLLLWCLDIDRRGRGGTLKDCLEFLLLRGDLLMERDSVLQFVGSFREVAEAGLLLFGHGGGFALFVLGVHVLKGTHLRQHGSEFVQQHLDLRSHVVSPCDRCRG